MKYMIINLVFEELVPGHKLIEFNLYPTHTYDAISKGYNIIGAL